MGSDMGLLYEGACYGKLFSVSNLAEAEGTEELIKKRGIFSEF